MRLGLVPLVVLLLSASPAETQPDAPAPPAAAQPAPGAAAATRPPPAAAQPPSCRPSGPLGARALFELTRDPPEGSTHPAIPLLPMTAGRYSAAAQGSLRMELARDAPGLKDALPEWQRVRFIGAARPDEATVHGHTGLFVETSRIGDDAASIVVHMPANRGGWLAERWHVVVGICAADNRLVGYGVATVRVSPLGLSVAVTLLVLLLLWIAAASVAARENRRKLHRWWVDRGGTVPPAPASWRTALAPEHRARLVAKGLRAMDPVFISQDALGAGSLGRLQLLVLSFAVIGVVFYVFLRTGAFAGLSNDILALLGITAGGSAFARAAALRRPLTPPQRRILFGSGVVNAAEPMPTLRDVLGGGGELDVTRLQAFAFTGFAVVALVSSGVADLAAFTLPPEMLSVLGLSQGVYVVGKLVPSESETTLRNDMDTLRREAAGVAAAGGTPTPAFAQAQFAAAESLEQVFAERFDRARFMALAPAALV